MNRTEALTSALLFATLLPVFQACNGNTPGNALFGNDRIAQEPAFRTGTVAETMDGGPYTYVLLDTGSSRTWVAGPKTTVRIGDRVTTPCGIPMRDFGSRTLERTFDVVYFVSEITTGDLSQVAAPLPPGHPAMPPGHPPVRPPNHPPVEARETPPGSSLAGTVKETMDADRYTYVHVESNTTNIWAAAPSFTVKIGDRVRVPTGMPMQNFHSRILGRTFPLIYFTGNIQIVEPGAPVAQ